MKTTLYNEGNKVFPETQDEELIYAACGDSITGGNQDGIDDIPVDDPYCPFDGTPAKWSHYRQKTYPYFIAKKYGMKWANYGLWGSTLTNCKFNGESQNGFVDDSADSPRYKNLADVAWTHISLFFGWNDSAFGVWQQKEMWLAETYGTTIYFPQTASKIGTTHTDGTPYTTQAQYDACQAASGVIDGVTYSGEEYFRKRMLGNINSTDDKTWFGAWNKLLAYLLVHYPTAKILLIVPYTRSTYNDGPTEAQRDAVIAIANKWGVPYYDFRTENRIFEKNTTTLAGTWVNGAGTTLPQTVAGFRSAYMQHDQLHPTLNGYKYMATSIGNKLMGI